jgi:hypothetical protein
MVYSSYLFPSPPNFDISVESASITSFNPHLFFISVLFLFLFFLFPGLVNRQFYSCLVYIDWIRPAASRAMPVPLALLSLAQERELDETLAHL